jgi:hypothetical protein
MAEQLPFPSEGGYLMPEENATTTYLVPAPFSEAADLVRSVLHRANLQITGELDISGHLSKSLLIRTAPCVILLASCGTDESEAAAPTLSDAVFMPLHVVIASRGSVTEIHILKELPPGSSDRSQNDVLDGLKRAIREAIEEIGMRASLLG